jgi:heavy metal sensor kinase
MRESLRGRLLAWYALILTLVMGLFGGAVCYQFWRTAIREVDEDLALRVAAVEGALRQVAPRVFDLDLPAAYLQASSEDDGRRVYHVIWGPDGTIVDRSDPEVDIATPAAPGFRTRDGHREIVRDASVGVTVLVGRDLAPVRREMWSLAGTVASVGLLALGLSLAGGWFLAGTALAPIARISRTARAMSDGDLAARIAVDRTETELGQLALALNGAFGRLQDALDRQRQFTADASHELRTPLAILLAEIEWSLARARPVEHYRESLETCRTAATQMGAVVEGLLMLARSDAGDAQARPVRLSLHAAVQDVVRLLRPLATSRHVRIEVEEFDVDVMGDSGRLRVALTNLVSNAIQYNRQGGRVEITATLEGSYAQLAIADTGCGIGPADLPHVFDRFFRADRARSRDAGGVGLGLAVAKAIVEGCGGTIACSSDPGIGSRFVVQLPALPRVLTEEASVPSKAARG